MLDGDGRIQPAFDPKRPDFKVELPESKKDLAPAVVDLLASLQIERHVRRARDEGTNRLKKEVTLSPEFAELWKRIKPKTTYRVEFATVCWCNGRSMRLKQMETDREAAHSAGGWKIGRPERWRNRRSRQCSRGKGAVEGPVPDLLA